jgi:hypothetical protein
LSWRIWASALDGVEDGVLEIVAGGVGLGDIVLGAALDQFEGLGIVF